MRSGTWIEARSIFKMSTSNIKSTFIVTFLVGDHIVFLYDYGMERREPFVILYLFSWFAMIAVVLQRESLIASIVIQR